MDGIEQHYNKVLEEAHDVFKKKAEDYDSVVGLFSYFPFGHASFLHELNKKLLRVQNIIRSQATPNFESIRDSLIDMINYAVFYVIWLDLQRTDEAKTRGEERG